MVKPQVELEKLNIDPNEIKEIPFQCQVFFTTNEGHRFVRVMTRKQEVSHDQLEVEKNAKIGLLAARAKERASNLALEGKIDEAKKINSDWNSYLQKNSKLKPMNHPGQKSFHNFSAHNQKIATSINQIEQINFQEKKSSKELMDKDQHFDDLIDVSKAKFVGRTEEDLD